MNVNEKKILIANSMRMFAFEKSQIVKLVENCTRMAFILLSFGLTFLTTRRVT